MFAHIAPEALLISLALLVSLVRPKFGAMWFTAAERWLAKIAQQRSLAVAVCGVLALALRLAILPWLPIPKPFINDEFSFLLASDTFAHGRLANPVHPMWIHWETFHVIFQPTYSSMYPPLQGFALAFGQVLWGHPFWGVWLSIGVMCAAICWMLQAWLPPTWALLGGMLPVFRFGVFSYWDNAYWGGALATTAGALVLGAVPRILRHRRSRDAVVMAIGIAMLANTRPYEGLVLSLAALAYLAVRAIKLRATALFRLTIPMIFVLAICGAGTCYYFSRVTGSATRMPQQVNRDHYAIARYFYGQRAYPQPAFTHKEIRDFYNGLELTEFQRAQKVSGAFQQMGTKTALIWAFYIAPLLTPSLFFLPQVVRDRRIRPLLFFAGAGFIASAAVIFFNIHYIAPIVSAMIAIVVQGLRHLKHWRWEGRPVGLALVRGIAVMAMAMVPLQVRILAAPVQPGTWAAIGPQRAAIEAQIESTPEPALILVRYRPDHNALWEWVYNGADIDRQKVIWARDMGSDQNQELLRYYADRRVWLLEPDEIPLRLSPYVVAQQGDRKEARIR